MRIPVQILQCYRDGIDAKIAQSMYPHFFPYSVQKWYRAMSRPISERMGRSDYAVVGRACALRVVDATTVNNTGELACEECLGEYDRKEPTIGPARGKVSLDSDVDYTYRRYSDVPDAPFLAGGKHPAIDGSGDDIRMPARAKAAA